jgi:adenosylcobinamide kinase / adenosylcobinamide-phosphate guanylyltransferase
MVTLILGGARSGKSRFAQSLCSSSVRVAYIATARIEDEEMLVRVNRHRQHRPPSWTTVEEPLAIAEVVAQHAPNFDFLLLDCLTLWLSNLYWELRQEALQRIEQVAIEEIRRLISAAALTPLVVVTNETGSGVVPETSSGRVFRDLQGWINQEMARQAQVVYLMVAGIPMIIKQQEKGVE